MNNAISNTINAIDTGLDFAATVRTVGVETIATISLLMDNSVGLQEAAIEFAQSVAQVMGTIFYAIKFACYFAYFAGQYAGKLYAAGKVDQQITEGLRGFVPAVVEGRETETPEVVVQVARVCGRTVGKFVVMVVEGYCWMLGYGG